MNRPRVALLFLLVSAAWAEDGLPGLGPVPRTVPAAPIPDAEVGLPEDDRLQRALDRLVRTRDQQIVVVRQAGEPGPVPVPDPEDPAVAVPLKDHSTARRTLRQALTDYIERTPRDRRDVLDSGGRRAQLALAGPLVNANLLAAAECYKDLAAAPGGSRADIAEGLTLLDGIDSTKLPDGDRPRALYLRLWFLCEDVRKGSPEGRAAALAKARAVQTELTASFPASELALTSESLFIALDLPAPPPEATAGAFDGAAPAPAASAGPAVTAPAPEAHHGH